MTPAESVKMFMRYYSPPAINAPEAEWRGFLLFHIKGIRAVQEVIQRDLCRVHEELGARISTLEDDLRRDGRQLGQHARSLRELELSSFELGQRVDEVNTLLDKVAQHAGLDLFPDPEPAAQGIGPSQSLAQSSTAPVVNLYAGDEQEPVRHKNGLEAE